MSRRLLLALACAGLASGLVIAAITLASDHIDDPESETVLRLLVGWSFIGTGLFAWWRRPANATGRLMVAAGFAWFATSLSASDNDLLFTIGISLDALFPAICGHLLIAFPSGRLETRAERWVVGGTYFTVTVLQLPSLLFEEPAIETDRLDWQTLPGLRVDPSDPQASWLHGLTQGTPQERLALLHKAPATSPEVHLAICRAALAAGQPDLVDSAANAMLRVDPWEWRAVWMQGLSALQQGEPRVAQSAFNAVYGQVPGELAPKLALAIACEHSGEFDVAEGLYLTCARTDANYIAPSAFGLTDIRTSRGDVDGALAALDLVPRTSGAYVRARRQRAGLLAGSGRGLPALAQAMDSIATLTIDPVDRANLAADVFRTALTEVQQSGPQEALRIDGRAATESSLRDGLEATYRFLADQAPTRTERIVLVDWANEVRGWTLR